MRSSDTASLRSRRAAHRGSVLVVSMVILFALAGLVLALNRAARVDAALAANRQATEQADAIERGAEQFILAMLTDYRDSLDDFTEQDFEQIPVGEGYFWVIRPNYDDTSLPSFGLMDESSKISLNNRGALDLTALPGMTDEIASSIIDWADEDDTPTGSGAESAGYLAGTDGYRAKNAGFEAVEELLLVKGMTSELLYGAAPDKNVINTEYYQTHGLFDFFTAWSRQPNRAADGTRRVDVHNRAQTQQVLRDKISQTRANEIMARVGGTDPLNVFDLAQRGGISYDELLLVEDYLTHSVARTLRGLINVNTAPREVLLALPGLSEPDVDNLLARRSTEVLSHPNSVAWVFDVLRERSILIGNQITGQGRQYSADIVAVSRHGRAFKRVRIVVDTVPTPPRIVYRRDLTERGWPLEQAVLDSIKSGGPR